METANQFTIYDIEAEEFSQEPEKKSSLFVVLIKATGIFFTITLIVFGIANYPYIKSQLVEWRREQKGEKKDYNKDSDGDGMPDWWEKEVGLDAKNPKDSSQDADNDLVPNVVEYQNNIDPLNPDSDGDGYFDGEEIAKGYNPNGLGRSDEDKDGLPDWWEELYGLNKNDASDAELDDDQDGLSNKEEFQYYSNPKNPDTDSDGVEDGEEVLQGQNPAGEGTLEEFLKQTNTTDRDGDQLDIFYEELFGTDKENKDSDGDGYGDYIEASRGYDPTGEGMIGATVEIPVIGVSAPLVWSQSEDEEEINKELLQGMIHYPETAMPGMRGNSYITGHSSYYLWETSKYKEILKDANNLKKGDKIIVRLSFKSGSNVEVVYVVDSKEIVQPNDKRLFRDYEGYELTLVTCWPIGTDKERLMIKAELTSPLPGS